MRSSVRRLVGPTALAVPIVVAALAAPVAARGGPPGVVFDGVATVEVRASADPEDGPGAPLPDVLVTVVTYVTDFPEEPPLQPPLTGLTGPDGRVSFTGLARPAAPGTTVHVAVDAFRTSEVPGSGGCTTTEVWAANVGDLTWPPSDPIVLEAVRTATVACPALPVLEGRLLDSRGDALAVRDAWVSVGVEGSPADTIPLAVGADGAFAVELPAMGTYLEPATLAVRANGRPKRTVPFGNGCLRTLADEVAWTRPVALAEGERIGFVELTAVETVVGERCGTTSTDPTASPRPAVVPGPVRSEPPRAAPALSAPRAAATPAATGPSPSPTGTAAVPSAGVAGRTAAPETPARASAAPSRGPAIAGVVPTPRAERPPAGGAATPARTGTVELMALLGAVVLMSVTLAIVVRLSRRV